MATITQPQPLTTEQLLAMPEEGKERWLICGELREKEAATRTRGHGRVAGRIAYLLSIWADVHAQPRGEVLVGDVGVRLRRNPDTSVGIDVTYVSPQVAHANPDDESFLEGAPVLVVEILSPSDKHEEVTEKVEAYLEAGVAIVWVVDPSFRTIIVHRADAQPQLFNITQSIEAEPHLPGFRAAVKEIFAR